MKTHYTRAEVKNLLREILHDRSRLNEDKDDYVNHGNPVSYHHHSHEYYKHEAGKHPENSWEHVASSKAADLHARAYNAAHDLEKQGSRGGYGANYRKAAKLADRASRVADNVSHNTRGNPHRFDYREWR